MKVIINPTGEALNFGTQDVLVVTVGDLDKGVVPQTKDLEKYGDLIVKSLKEGGLLVVPPIVKFQVIKGRPSIWSTLKRVFVG